MLNFFCFLVHLNKLPPTTIFMFHSLPHRHFATVTRWLERSIKYFPWELPFDPLKSHPSVAGLQLYEISHDAA